VKAAVTAEHAVLSLLPILVHAVQLSATMSRTLSLTWRWKSGLSDILDQIPPDGGKK
jgi:hypothetical protein